LRIQSFNFVTISAIQKTKSNNGDYLKLTALLLCLGTLGPAYSQSGAVLTAAGYSAPPPLQVAPGQVTTFFFRGIGALADGQLRNAQAASVPLPTNLAGLSLHMSQGQASGVAVPIFAVRQESECDSPQEVNATCLLTLVKLQVPFEIAGDVTPASPSGPTAPVLAPLGQLTLEVDGQSGRAISLQPVPDNAHVLTSCDLSWDTKYSSACDRQVYHADGRLISATEPAKNGETVIVYVYGLGKPEGHVPSGDVSPAGAALGNVSARVKASFDNFVNIVSSVPRSVRTDILPDFPIAAAGLTSGQVGLYQLNIRVPSSLTPAVTCGGFNGSIHSNAALYVSTSQGTEAVGLCVQP
jgi:uncharacterized protein (TIGR03437 family)